MINFVKYMVISKIISRKNSKSWFLTKCFIKTKKVTGNCDGKVDGKVRMMDENKKVFW